MLNVDPFQQHVAARLLDFFSSVTLWHRRLWSTGLVLTLKELLEASEAVQASVLSEASLKYLSKTASSLMGTDPGVGPVEQRRLLQQYLRTELRFGGIEYLAIKQIVQEINQNYLSRWAIALSAPTQIGPERTARAIASHLLDSGLSPEYLHRWWGYRIQHEPTIRTLADIVTEVHQLVMQGDRDYEVLVAFEAAPKGKSGMPRIWLSAPDVSNWLRNNNFKVEGIRQNGGILLKVRARDPWSAVEASVEIVDSFIARVAVGTRQRLIPVQMAWIVGENKPFSFSRRRRGLEVSALYREDQLYPEGKTNVVDAALELLEPLASGSPGPAASGGWAAIEALLSSPGTDNVLAGDHLAAIVACSFPRAELTTLSYKAEKAGSATITPLLRACGSNRDRAALLADMIQREMPLNLTDGSDQAAVSRMQVLLANPYPVICDVQGHVIATFRRLYRSRNLVLHWGRTNAVALRASLRTAALLVGAGMDRIAHAWFVENLSPLELAARANIRLSLVGTTGAVGPIDLLER